MNAVTPSKRVIEGFRLSPQQKHIWLLQETGQGVPYRAQCETRLEGDLDIRKLQAAVEDVVGRYEILRTAFDYLPGMVLPLQVISGGHPLDWSRTDLTGLAPPEQERALMSRSREELRKPLDLRCTPLLSACLAALGPGRHVLTLTLPALCGDAASLDLVVREIARSYGGRQEGEDAEPASQYADLSEILNELVESPDTEAGRDFWRRLEIPALPETRLPLEREGAADPFDPRVLEADLSTGLAEGIGTLAGEAVTSPGTVCLAAWLVLLRRLTGSADSLVGVRSDGRTYEELRDAPGLFARYLPLRSSPSPDRPFDEFLGSVGGAVGDLQQWQEFFSWESLGAVAGEARGPLHPAFGFDFQEGHAAFSEGGVRFSISRRYDCTDRFRVKLACGPADGSLATQWHFDGSRFAPADMQRLAGHFERLLAAIADDPKTPIGQLEVVTDAERRRLLVDLNATDTDARESKTVVRLFEEQAARRPERPAVVSGGESLTYAELNRRANRLARHLEALGVGPEARVAVCMDRSIDLVVGLLGILKAGAAYVPVDPGYPAERLAFLLADSEAQVLLTRGDLASRATGTRVVRLDSDRDLIARRPDGNPGRDPAPESLAYVIYTSGSTGQPKGVMVPHRALANYVTWSMEAYGVGGGSGSVVHSSIGFDLTITSVFPSLSTGATLFLVPEEEGIDGLGEALRRAENLSLVKITPSHLELLGESLPGDAVSGRTRALIIGGEALRSETLAFWRRHAPETRLINEYGPTEATVGCCVYEVPMDAPESGPVPIGRPIANTKLYVLDDRQRLAPLGVAGELSIGGDGVARGYLGRPDLTAERFLPDPFGEPGSRLYRTGDLVRYAPDGNLEYLGRLDEQVKLRGFRIEPGEVEAALRSHPGVRDAAVLLREDAPGDKRLVAYVAPDAGFPPGIEELHSHVKGKLPDYMIPSAFVFLDALPLTSHGKLDRAALPRPEDGPRSGIVPAAPRNPTEEVLAGIWCEVLGVADIGIHDDFFLRGGHSLLATQVIARVRQALQVDLPLRALFEAPSVAGLADRVASARADGAVRPPPPVVRVPRDGDLPLSFEQERLWFADQLEPNDPSYNVFLALRLTGDLDTEALQEALNAVAARHESLRTEFASRHGVPVQRISAGASVPIETQDLTGTPPERQDGEVAEAMAAEAQRPFDLSRGPLLRMRLLKLGASESVILLTMHHIVSDAWSCGILFRELALLYGRFAAGIPASLPELPVQYADYAAWQREYLQGEVLERHLAYWTSTLSGAPARTGLPVLPRPASPGKQASLLRFALPDKAAEGVRRLAREEHATFFMTLLAAFKAALYAQTRDEDVVVGTDVGNRNRVEFEGLIGCFVNNVVMRTSLAGNPTFREVLRRVRETALGAYAHQDLPFQKLVEQLQPKRSPGQTPLFQVLFVLQNAPMEALQLTGLTLTPMTLDGELAKFELALFLEEKPDGLAGTWVYRTDLFQAATVSDLSADFEMLLDVAAASPDTRLDELPALLAAKRSESIGVRRRGTGADRLRAPRGELAEVPK